MLCGRCNYSFTSLSVYIDTSMEELCVKVVGDQSILEYYKAQRVLVFDQIKDRNRPTVEDGDGNLVLNFIEGFPMPNRKSLDFHRDACSIWQSATGNRAFRM